MAKLSPGMGIGEHCEQRHGKGNGLHGGCAVKSKLEVAGTKGAKDGKIMVLIWAASSVSRQPVEGQRASTRL